MLIYLLWNLHIVCKNQSKRWNIDKKTPSKTVFKKRKRCVIYDVLVLTSLVYDWLFLSTYVACHLCFLLRLLFCFCFIDFCMSVLCDSLWKWFIGRHEYSVTFFFNFENFIFRKIIKWYKILTFFLRAFSWFQKNITGICSCNQYAKITK